MRLIATVAVVAAVVAAAVIVFATATHHLGGLLFLPPLLFLKFGKCLSVLFQLVPLLQDETTIFFPLCPLSFSNGLWLFGTKQVVTWSSVTSKDGNGANTNHRQTSNGDPSLMR